MQLLVKVGDRVPTDHVNYLRYWRDGQIVDIRPDGYYDNSSHTKVSGCVIQTQHDFWLLRGSMDWKSTSSSVFTLKNYLAPTDSAGKLPWESFYNTDEKRARRRDWFIDFEFLRLQGWITQAQYDSIYDKGKSHLPIYIDRDLTQYLFHEDIETRIISGIKNDAATSGSFTVGAAGHATDLADAEANHIGSPLTGNLTVEHLDEETSISTDVTFDIDTTGSFLLKITAQSGAEHDGGAYGNGARINYGTADSIAFDESTGDTLVDLEISNLALNVAGTGNNGVRLVDCAAGGLALVNRILIEGDGASSLGIRVETNARNNRIINNIIYGIGDGGNDGGISFANINTNDVVYAANNTCIKNYNNFIQVTPSLTGTLTFKNNIAQGDIGGSDYNDSGGGGWGTSGVNVSEDATSPDASYQSKDLHTNTIFNDYTNDDYKLDSGGDSTNLAIVDDGEDLSGVFTDDIIGQTRSTWYIGASEIVAVGGVALRTLSLLGCGI